MKPYILLLTGMLSVASTTYAADDNSTLVINELMQSNIDCIMDDIKEFPDSWVELYNPTSEAINLKDYKIGIKNKAGKAWQLPDRMVGSHQHIVIYCDKEGKEDNRLHTDFRLESGKDGNLYLFKGNEVVDKLEKMAKMPAPNIAYGRESDGGEVWGYELHPTPGEINGGMVVDADKLLPAPLFSKNGQVLPNGTSFQLTLSVPEEAPAGTTIRYTTDGSEPTIASTLYNGPITISETKVIRAKLFCGDYLSPVSTAQSYIFHPREMTTPIFSVLTDDRYLNDAEIGLFANNKSKADKKDHDWRRPVNIEFFTAEGEESIFNQLSETRIQGGQSRGNELKSMVFYANKRFDPDHKQFQYEFFPDQKPGINKFKAFSLRDGGNDFSDLYFRDAIIQRTMASHTDLDWQACRTAVLYINGEYMGMLNIRERSNAENIYSNYNGLEDIDMVEISHEQVNGQDQFIEELKEGTFDFYNDFKAFYSEKGHTKAEYEQWMDVDEYLNVAALNLFYGNNDWPGNNTIFWRPNDDDTKSGLPKIWRVIVKDTDFGLGLYGKQNNYNMIDLLYHPENHSSDAWAFTEPATRLLKNMLENEDIRNLFIDKCCIFMGDFMNGKGTGEVIDLIKDEAMEEFVAHRDKYNPGWGWFPPDNRSEITNKFNNAKSWAEGRPNNFYQHIANQWNLKTPIDLTINKENKCDVVLTFNGVQMSGNIFDGKYFKNRTITLSGTPAEEGKEVIGWKVTGAINKEYQGSELTLNMPSSKIAINPIVGVGSGIEDIERSTVNAQQSTIYDLMGNKVTTPQAGRIYIKNGKKFVMK